ncbi:hypothetical protein [Rufibacter quisquiliarum]|uniref:Uncharacterized protein n=1 Tax=Rufibacter quisquiliarum TaxID=1549639 RepID=A0A839GI38_9BACT|nr:hypothetical protein [Rufibacter quisquiliarum]MBA9078290.1 hypothetical protein [Rufibacter quisquiliarum]
MFTNPTSHFEFSTSYEQEPETTMQPTRVSFDAEQRIDHYTAQLNKELKRLHNSATRPSISCAEELEDFLLKESLDPIKKMAKEEAHGANSEVADAARRYGYAYCIILATNPTLPIKKRKPSFNVA